MNKIIEIATKEIGYSETPANSNSTKYGIWFDLNELPWCGIFVSWLYHFAGFSLPVIGFWKGFASCQKAVQYFKKHNQITTKPIPGDIVFFDFNQDERYDHCGIYYCGCNPIYFKTIEGNTSLRNQNNGGEVMVKRRKYKEAIFVHCLIPDKENDSHKTVGII